MDKLKALSGRGDTAAPEKKKTSKRKFNEMRGIGVSPASPKKKIDGKDLQLDPNFIAEYREKMGKSNSGK